ncbi:hypothetical protein WICMUC_000794 [Wickerhamomyces mucosus]|uniref:rRNA methyltransferase 1, mitochondrial n=1 Tax=Wickerhamomyces mucosus TaxID=1378264 RepID=A0A9P8TI40_9ASCO|nr:hypothetical protein WICMUC_000794 [Wickerhamomyces mucosus]
MSFCTKRCFSINTTVLKNIQPAVKLENTSKPGQTQRFERNFPVKSSQKAWEREGLDKDTFFKKKYAHVHARNKGTEEDIKSRDHYRELRKTKRKEENNEFKQQRFQHRNKYDSRDVYKTLKPNPLSEFIYGTSAVIAALEANKREFFNKLYIHKPDSKDREIIKLATKLGVRTVTVDSKHELNVLTNNAVHNGYVLETKALAPTSIFQLGETSGKDYFIDEDNFGDSLKQPFRTQNSNPLGIYLDGVTDPHNIGAIIRSAYFLGADFLVMSERNSAPLSPIVTKTSVGATEFLPIMTVNKPLSFFDKSRENGWTFIAADSISSVHRDAKIAQTLQSKFLKTDDLSSLLEKGPCVLVMGSEGEGIRTTLKLKSDYLVEIEKPRHINPVIDSLNVSVATALLIQKILN